MLGAKYGISVQACSGRAVPQTAPISVVTRRHKSGLLNFASIRQKMTTTTEDAVLRASNGADRRDCSSTERFLFVRAHLEVAMRNHGSPQVGGQPGEAPLARFPAPQKNGPAVGVTVMSHPRLRSCLSSSAGSCGTFTIR